MRNLKPLSLSVFLFTLTRERIFIKTHSTEIRWVVGPENILFAGATVHLSTGGNFTAWGSEGVNTEYCPFTVERHKFMSVFFLFFLMYI